MNEKKELQSEINMLVLNIIKKIINKYIYCILFRKHKINYITIFILSNYINDILFFLNKNNLFLYKLLNDICVVDYPNNKKRFQIIYNITSVQYNTRLFLKTFLEDILINTVTNIFTSAGWLERENWDLFGIYFINHIDLRRILTDYGFEGHPLRKDFPINGYIELRFDEEKYLIVYEPIQLTQEYRLFNFSSPWENLM